MPPSPNDTTQDARQSSAKPARIAKQTIQIADDDFELVQLLTMLCRKLDLEVFRSPDALHALLGAQRLKPDLLLLDVNMPSGNGLSVCEFLGADSKLSEMPIIIMSGQSDAETVRRCRSLGACFVKKGPHLWSQLQPLICQLLRRTAARGAGEAPQPPGHEKPTRATPKVLCIDDDPDVSKIIQLRLAPYGVEVHRAFQGMQGYWTSIDIRPDVIITDMAMPDGEGNYIFSRLRSHPLTKNTPVIMLTGQCNPGLRRQILSLGVDAYLTKPIVFDDLLQHLRQHIELSDQPLPTAAATVDCKPETDADVGAQASPP
jgi:DNA-binding response OmpR family regulator